MKQMAWSTQSKKIEKISQLKTKMSKINEEKNKIIIELQDLKNSVKELEMKCQHEVDKMPKMVVCVALTL